ncbi:amidase domain-containing protein [Streptomyces sp. ID05-26A]|nr:amidase domain-containing protein [Streptomyces sp. ID05-26A]
MLVLVAGGTPASADITEIGEKDRAHLLSLSGRYLQDRADRLAQDVRKADLTSVPVSVSLDSRLAADRDAIDERRALLKHANGGHKAAEVAVLAPRVDRSGVRATVRFTEHTKLYFTAPSPGGPLYEEYGLGRELTFALESGEWRLAGLASGIRPGSLAPDTEPNAPGAIRSTAPKIGSVGPRSSATTRPSAAQLAEAGTKVVAKPGLDGSGVSASYDYAAMLNYAVRYWGPTNNEYNQAYRTYGGVGGDCTNFLSQIMGAGGWTTVGSWPGDDRTDDSKWFYGDFTWTTSYTWAAAENWYWFALHRSQRTSFVDNVWKLLVTDVLQVDFDRDDNISHSMFVSDRVGNGEWASELWLTYHSSNDHNERAKPLSSFIATYPDSWYYAHRT